MKQQTRRAFTLATPTKTIAIPRTEIKILRENPLSIMPQGLIAILTSHGVRGRLFCLRRAGQDPLVATPENVALFFNSKDLSCQDGDPQTARHGITGLQVHAGALTEVCFKGFRVKLDPMFELEAVLASP